MRGVMTRAGAALVLGLTVVASCGTTSKPSRSVQGSAPGPSEGSGLGTPVPPSAASTSGSGASVGGSGANVAPGTASAGSSQADTSAVSAGGAAPAAPGGPIKVGFLSVNNDAAASAGVKNGNSFQERQVFEALVAAYNRNGGLAGRRVVPTYQELNSSSSNYATTLQAACFAFTQDSHVAAVISAVGLWSQSFASCLAAAGVPQFEGSYAVGDASDLSNDPGVLAPSTLSLDQGAAVILHGLAPTGYLSRTTKLGVVVEGCPDNERAFRTTVVPIAAQLGIPLAPEFSSTCFQGVSDLGKLASDMQNAVLKFKTEGVQRVTFVSSVQGDLLLLFTTAATQDSYYPGYALSSLALPVVAEANMPASQLANFRGVGWLPVLDENAGVGTQTPADRACVALLRQGDGPPPSSAEDYYFAYAGCDVVGLYARALQVAGGVLPAARVRSVGRSIGRSFTTATSYEGASDFLNRPAGASVGREFTWSGACSCFVYTGPTIDLPAVDH